MLVIVLALLLGSGQKALSQAARYSGSVSTLSSSIADPMCNTLDSKGNLFVSDSQNNVVKQIVAGTGGAASGRVNTSSTVVTVGTGFSSPCGLAVDAGGNVFVADSGNNQVKEILAGTGGAPAGTVTSSSTIVVVGSSFFFPRGVAVDAVGNVFVADAENNRVAEIVAGTGGAPAGTVTAASTVITVGTGFSFPTGVALDRSGNLFVADYNNHQVKRLTGVGGSSAMTAGVTNTPGSTGTVVGSGFTGPFSVAVDFSGNVFVADRQGNAVKEIVAGTGGASAGTVNASSTVIGWGTGFNYPSGVAVDGFGSLFVSDESNFLEKQIVMGVADFGSVDFGLATPPTQTLTFTFTAAGTIGGVSVQAQGGIFGGVDFVNKNTGTCNTNPVATNYNIGDTCTVVVSFTPQTPGLRVGAVKLNNSGGTAIATARVSGTGLVPVVAYPNTSSYFEVNGMGPINRSAYGLNPTGSSASLDLDARGVAVDPYGNLYVSATNSGTVAEYAAGTGRTAWGAVNYDSAQLPVPQAGSGFAFSHPEGLAIDFFGNVFVADPGKTEKVFKVVGSTVTQVGHGFGNVHHIAVDTSGNLWVADTDNNAVKEVLAGPDGMVDVSSTVITVGSGFTSPYGIVVDASGNVFVSDATGVKEIVAGTGGATVIPINAAFGSHSGGLALDAFGNLYVGNASYGQGSTAAMKIVAGANGTVSAASTVSYIYISGGYGGPSWDVAVNASGYLFILDQPQCVSVPSCPYNINSAPEVFSYQTAPSLLFPTTTDGSTSLAYALRDGTGNVRNGLQAITVVNTGNAPLVISAPSVSSGFAVDTSSATTCPLVSGTLPVGATCNYSVLFAPTYPMDGPVTGTLTINSNAAPGHQYISLSGTAAVPAAAALKFTTPPPATLAVGGNAGIVVVSVTDGGVNIAPTAYGAITLRVMSPSSTAVYTQYTVGGRATFDLSSIPLNTATSYSFYAEAAASPNGACTIYIAQTTTCLGGTWAYTNVIGTSYTAPSEPTGTSSGPQQTTILFPAGVTLNSDPEIAFQVLTKGALNQDFAYASGGTCVAGSTYSAGQSCTVNYTFTPKYPGQRLGAIVLYDNAATPAPISILHLSGTGQAPMVTYPGNTTPVPLGSGLTLPLGSAAIDGHGNLFVADYGGRTVTEFLAGTGGAAPGTVNANSTVVTFSSGLTAPSGVAVDGAGNLFIADYNGNAVYEILAGTGGAAIGTVNPSSTMIPVGSGFLLPFGIAVDASGNVFVSDSVSNSDTPVGEVNEIMAGSNGTVDASSTIKTVGSNFNMPYGMAVDASGNVFVADYLGGVVKQIVSGTGGAGSGNVNASSTVKTIGSGFNNPNSVALDVNGNVYVADSGDNVIEQIVAQNGVLDASSTVNTIVSAPAASGVTLDPAGNLLVVSMTSASVSEYPFASAPTLTFPGTLNGSTSTAQTVTVKNSGNQTLNVAVPSSGKNPSIAPYFTLDSTGVTACPLLTSSSSSAGTLAQNSTCTLPVTFAPVGLTGGPVYGTLVMTDNHLNVAGATQTIALNGSVTIPITAFTITATPATVQAGEGASFTLTAMDGANVATAYTGTVHFTSSDAQATFTPSSYTFTVADAGVHTFTNGAFLHTVGNQTITATDPLAEVSQTSANIAVTVGVPAYVQSAGGGGQSVAIGSAFANPLAIQVTDFWGNPVSGVTVNYTVPSTGASATLSDSGTVVTGSNGTASVTATANATAGAYTVMATSPDLANDTMRISQTPPSWGTNGQSSTIAHFSLTNLLATPTVVLTPSPASPISYGQAATALGATVSYTAGSPTGNVTFKDGNSALGAAVAINAGAASFPAQYYAPGSHSFTAAYAGDANYNAVTSAASSYVVNKASSTLTGPATQPVFVVYQTAGAIPVAITGQFSGTGIAKPTGSVAYALYLDNALISSDALTIADGAVSVPVASTLAPGLYRVTLAYEGDANYNAATSIEAALQVGKIQPTISWTQPSSVVYGTTLNGLLNAVAMHNTSTVAGTYAYTATPTGGTDVAVTNSTVLVAGSYTLTVQFTPDAAQTYKTATGSVTLTVTKATPGVTLASSFNPSMLTNPVTLTATVSSAVSTPTGTVNFLDGTTPLGVGTVNANGVATLTLSTLTLGSHSITAVYSGDANFITVTSSALTQAVQDFNLTITASGGSTGGTSLTILPGGTAIYTFTVSPIGSTTFPAAVTLSVSGLPAGATYSFSPATLAKGAGATQVTLTVNVPQVAALNLPPVAGQNSAPLEVAGNKPASKLPLLALALLLLPFTGKLRRAARKLGRVVPLLLLAVGMAALAGLSGCTKASGYFGQAPKTYSVTVTGTSGVLVHSTSVTLTVE